MKRSRYRKWRIAAACEGSVTRGAAALAANSIRSRLFAEIPSVLFELVKWQCQYHQRGAAKRAAPQRKRVAKHQSEETAHVGAESSEMRRHLCDIVRENARRERRRCEEVTLENIAETGAERHSTRGGSIMKTVAKMKQHGYRRRREGDIGSDKYQQKETKAMCACRRITRRGAGGNGCCVTKKKGNGVAAAARIIKQNNAARRLQRRPL
jgi:hypothetical protein